MIAYFDCFSGISGDMTLGAFLDLGVPVEWLKEQLGRLPAQIRSLITNSPLSRNIKQMSRDIFERIAQAEAVIHGCAVDAVHFHEVGGIDAIVDIVGTALCMEYLGIKKVTASHIPLGKGFVSCEHGTLPVPAPATLGILKGIPVYGTKIPNELVTPTGAAILVTLAESFGELPDMIIEKTGYGAGKRDLESIPNLLRVITGSDACRQTGHRSSHRKDTIVVLETCIDDMNPEMFGFLMDRLFEQGALDVYWIPIFMKKNRPGTMVQVLCRRNLKEVLIDCLLSETSSLGIRYYDVKRCMLTREKVIMKTAYGEIQVKRITESDGGVRIVPEYEVCKKIALEKKLPLRMVYDTIIQSLRDFI
jgi:uncharacterized protein (TIGR00299 family) protein